MTYARRTDGNQTEIVEALRSVGCFVQSTAVIGCGCPDLIVCYRGTWHMLEIKDPQAAPADRELTPAQTKWHKSALLAGGKVHICETPRDALQAVGVAE